TRPGPAGGTRPAAPGGELLGAARELLGLPGLGEDDDLLGAGATSLDVVRLAARAGARSGVRITVGDVYRLRTVAALNRHSEHAPPADGTVLATGGPAADGPVALSHAQRRFWMAERGSPGDADNVLVLAYLLTGPLDPGALWAALDDVAVRHPALRTVHPWLDELPEQRVLGGDRARVPFAVVPPPAGPSGAEPAAVARAVTEDWWRLPFALEEEIPIRARLCRLERQRHLLCLQIHHIAFDGWSESVLLAELGRCYQARPVEPGGESGSGPAPAASYADYARWEQAAAARWTREELPFWRRRLTDVPPPAWPAPARAGEAPRIETLTVLPGEVVEGAARAARRYG
ncbi:condensation domain-containing protein, partial [Streptomyces sp. CBMA123]|uniref:condensation domain-containing protein n=1 Tax=Streptomyces sp. CBMA123 TaxID=1896313 RepID=UPI001CB87D7D